MSHQMLLSPQTSTLTELHCIQSGNLIPQRLEHEDGDFVSHVAAMPR